MSGPSLTVHPEHISLGFLVTALVAPPPPETGWGSGHDGPTAQRLLSLFLLEEIHDTSRPTLSPLPQLLRGLQQRLGTAGSILSNVLIAGLQMLRAPDDLVSLAGRFGSFLAAPGTTPAEAVDASSISYISTSSPLGLFLRRVRLGLGNMSLQRLAVLAAAVQQQVQEALAAQQQQQQQHGAGQQQVAPTASSSNSSTGALKEPAVLDAYLNTLLAAVKSLGPCLPAPAVQAAAAPLSQLQDSMLKLQYLDLAVSLAHKDMAAALSALHQYFDRNGASSGPIPIGSFGVLGGSAAAGISSSSSKGKGQHQAALHSLSALQASLGHPQEALAALQELLRLGQQHGDEWSLLHGLAGLCRVMGSSEGLQPQDLQQGRAASGGAAAVGSASGAAGSSSGGGWAGWGLLDVRRTEQQLQLQALLQRCLDFSRDMRVPHVAAYAAVALCRFRLTHASSNSSNTALDASSTAVPNLSSSSRAAAAPVAATPAGTSLGVQRMLLDVATLEHQAAVAAAAPHTPAVAADAASAARTAQGQPPLTSPVAWSSELYNPTEAFGTGTSTAAPGVNVLAGATSSRAQAAGTGWRSSSAAVSQALAAGNALAAAALQLQGAGTLAAVRALMVLNGPGGAGVHDAGVVAALPQAAAAAARAAAAAARGDTASGDAAAPATTAAAAAAAAAAMAGAGASAAALTGSNTSADDVAAGWVQLIQLALELQGVAAAQHILTLAESHFPGEAPQQLAAAREVVRLQGALRAGRFADARLACEELQAVAPAVPLLGLELQLLAADAHVQLLQAAGCFAQAHDAAASLFATAAGAGMQPHAVGALLHMAKACLAAGDASGGLPYALSALLHAQVLQLDTLLPEAVLRVATAWQALAPDGAPFVLGLLQQVLPLAHAGGHLKIRAELEEGIAKLQLLHVEGSSSRMPPAHAAAGGAGGAKDGAAAAGASLTAAGEARLDAAVAQDVQQRLVAAATMLQQAGELKSAAGCWLLLAHVCNAAGWEQGRNAAAVKWQECKQRCSSVGQQHLGVGQAMLL